jgi:hypothetical protein
MGARQLCVAASNTCALQILASLDAEAVRWARGSPDSVVHPSSLAATQGVLRTTGRLLGPQSEFRRRVQWLSDFVDELIDALRDK